MIGSMKKPTPNEDNTEQEKLHATFTTRSLPLIQDSNMQQAFKEEFSRYSQKCFKYTFGTHTVEVEGMEYLVNWAEYLVRQEFNQSKNLPKTNNIAVEKLNDLFLLDTQQCSREVEIKEG